MVSISVFSMHCNLTMTSYYWRKRMRWAEPYRILHSNTVNGHQKKYSLCVYYYMQTLTCMKHHCWLANLAMNLFVARTPIRSSMITSGSVNMEVFSCVPTSTTIHISNMLSRTETSSTASAMHCPTVGEISHPQTFDLRLPDGYR